jgi:iron-sulfur cluster assembly accessory protein
MLAISASAVSHLRSLVGEDSSGGRGLRVLVERGGCAGLQYGMKVDEKREGDFVSEREGARVLVDAESASFLKGAELDYCDDLTGTGFRIVNPNAARSCGCGTSFEPATQASGVGSEAGTH